VDGDEDGGASSQTTALGLTFHDPSQTLVIVYERYYPMAAAAAGTSWAVEIRVRLLDTKTLKPLGASLRVDGYDARQRPRVSNMIYVSPRGLSLLMPRTTTTAATSNTTTTSPAILYIPYSNGREVIVASLEIIF
jgi:hypothetical protein